MNFKNLTDVHSRRHTQRVQNDVNRSAVSHERHVFDTSNAGDNTLVTVTAGHLVAGLQTTFNGQINLDHLLNACRQFVALSQFLALFVPSFVELFTFGFQGNTDVFDLLLQLFVSHANVKPLVNIQTVEVFLRNLLALA